MEQTFHCKAKCSHLLSGTDFTNLKIILSLYCFVVSEQTEWQNFHCMASFAVSSIKALPLFPKKPVCWRNYWALTYVWFTDNSYYFLDICFSRPLALGPICWPSAPRPHKISKCCFWLFTCLCYKVLICSLN